jgi:hypothetical protein
MERGHNKFCNTFFQIPYSKVDSHLHGKVWGRHAYVCVEDFASLQSPDSRNLPYLEHVGTTLSSRPVQHFLAQKRFQLGNQDRCRVLRYMVGRPDPHLLGCDVSWHHNYDTRENKFS